MSKQPSTTLATRWHEIATQLEKATDALGRPIDPGIMELVVALNVLGILTDSSCEGHLEHGHAAPWVDFYAPGTESVRRQASDANRALREAEEREDAPEVIQELVNEVFRLARTEQVTYYKGAWLVHQALEAFYDQHPSPYDQQLYLHSDSFGHSRLQPHGIDYQPQHTREVQATKLAQYQQEVQDFTQFLKNDYLLREHSDHQEV
ncbi:hypothetical protein KDA_40850 [Dictyobacter alpinus]|uniref:Uncharacterized protein n=1 Tax=Dictyobacter alpinus TaxID=2014873 RepID=A0A402BAZ7_9CHLR|nr:hypothetical protein [Dictyobacter alpinus]GCE28601.1 hypothetical protein KDA_40850 [Dictyobacter alpinus]